MLKRFKLIFLFVIFAILAPVAGFAGDHGVSIATPGIHVATVPVTPAVEKPETSDLRGFESVADEMDRLERDFGSKPLPPPPATGPEKVAQGLTLGWDAFKGVVKLPFRALGWGFAGVKNTVSVAGGTIQAGGEMAHEKTDSAQIWVDQGFK